MRYAITKIVEAENMKQALELEAKASVVSVDLIEKAYNVGFSRK
jgi:hypothetical protein